VNEIIRVLQLTTYDEDEWDTDNVTVMRKALSAAQSLLTAALDWLADPRGRPGSVGEKAIRRILDYSEKIAARSLPEDQYAIRRACSEITSLTDSLCELRTQGRDNQALTHFFFAFCRFSKDIFLKTLYLKNKILNF
jgi:vinculin